MADLRGNRSVEGRVLMPFHRGAPADHHPPGHLVDWSTQQPQRRRWSKPSSFPTVSSTGGLADSTGRFALGPCPAGEYLVYGVLDQNGDRRLADPRIVRHRAPRRGTGQPSASSGPFATTPFLPASPRPTRTIRLSLSLTFSQPLDPCQRLPADSVLVGCSRIQPRFRARDPAPRGLSTPPLPHSRGVDSAKGARRFHPGPRRQYPRRLDRPGPGSRRAPDSGGPSAADR